MSRDDLATEVRRLRLVQGNVVVVSTDKLISLHEANRIRDNVTSALFKAGKAEVPVLILDGGLRIEVLDTSLLREPALSEPLAPPPAFLKKTTGPLPPSGGSSGTRK